MSNTELDKPGRASIGARRNPETEAAILDAAQELLSEKGFAGLSMEAVAKRARAGKATLYRWYPNRGALVLAVHQRRKAGRAYKDTGSLDGDLNWLVAHIFDLWRGDMGMAFKCIIAEAQSQPDILAALQQFRSERIEGIKDVLDRAVQRGEITNAANQDVFAEQLLSFLWTSLITDQIDKDPTETISFLTSALKNG